ncbi:MAG: DNA-binding protein [Leifsonia xyli]|nr:MAG: DNA-binding protein [Leifsonia xyli]
MTEPATEWLAVPDLVDLLGISPGKVHRLLQDRHLLAVRVDGVLRVPAGFLRDGEPLHELRGTLMLLADAGYTDDEAMRWLTTSDDTLGVAPVDALRAGRKAEVRRVAQALAF